MPMRARQLDDLAGRLYDAAVEPSLWAGLLSDLADESGGNGACLMESDIVTGASEVIVSRHVDPAALPSFHAHYAFINPLLLVDDVAAYRAAYRPTMLRDEDWIERSALERTEYFNDFIGPLDARRGLFLRLRLNGQRLTSISVSRRQEHFSDDEMTRLGALHRHAVRAVALGARFADVGGFAAGATTAIDAVADPLFMLDADRGVVHLNPAAERLLGAGTLVRKVAGRLTATHPRLAADLAQAIGRATRRGSCEGASLMLASADGRHAARVDVLPIATGAALDAAGGPAVLVRVAAPARHDDPEGRLERLDLTGAESALVRLLLDGRTLRDAAAARGISFNTARRHLANVFDKAGVHRQAELIRLLTG